MKITRGEGVTGELFKMLDKETDMDRRLLLMMCALLDAPLKTKKALDMYCENLLKMSTRE